MDDLLEKVKQNLILDHAADDALLKGYITAAVSYAESYQHIPAGTYSNSPMPATTEQAVIMLSSHFYESRDGSTGRFLCGPMFKQVSRSGIPLIFFYGSTGIGRCDHELWKNERICGYRHSPQGKRPGGVCHHRL